MCDGMVSVTEKNEVLLFARTWMDLVIIIRPSDGSQVQKEKYPVTSPMCETEGNLSHGSWGGMW